MVEDAKTMVARRHEELPWQEALALSSVSLELKRFSSH
jgi:hypothetical protein